MTTPAMRTRAVAFLSTHHPILAAYCNLKTRDGIDTENAIMALAHLLEDVRVQERDRIKRTICKPCASRVTRPP